MAIPGGFVLQPRRLDESEVMREPPVTRELWLYILRRVNWRDSRKFKRGQGLFRYSEIQDDLCWYVGYRKKTYSKTQIMKSLRKLYEKNMIDKTKTTRGVVVTVLNYSFYQDPNNYEGYHEDNKETTRRPQCSDTILEEREEREEEEERSTRSQSDPPGTDAVTLPLASNNGVPAQKIAELWNTKRSENASILPQVAKISPKTQRYRHLKARWNENPDLSAWEVVFDKATKSDFLNGRVKAFMASFDWVVKSSDNFTKVLEGNYDNKKDNASSATGMTLEQFKEEFNLEIDTQDELEYWINRGTLRPDQRGRLQ